MIDFLERGKTLNEQYSTSVFKDNLKKTIKSKHCKKLRAGVLSLLINASVYTTQVAVAGATISGFVLLPHLPYSPVLALYDSSFLSKIKSYLRGHHFLEKILRSYVL